MKYLLFIVCALLVSPVYGQNFRRHSSTALEGLGYGLAAAIEADGYRTKKYAEALIDRETARQMYYNNKYRRAELYFDLKELNKRRRFGDMEAKPREWYERVAKEKLPQRLYVNEYGLSWPMVLQAPDFDEERSHIDYLYAKRSIRGQFFAGETIQLQRVVNKMYSKLREFSPYLSTHNTIIGRKFLDSLLYEADFTTEG